MPPPRYRRPTKRRTIRGGVRKSSIKKEKEVDNASKPPSKKESLHQRSDSKKNGAAHVLSGHGCGKSTKLVGDGAGKADVKERKDERAEEDTVKHEDEKDDIDDRESHTGNSESQESTYESLDEESDGGDCSGSSSSYYSESESEPDQDPPKEKMDTDQNVYTSNGTSCGSDHGSSHSNQSSDKVQCEEDMEIDVGSRQSIQPQTPIHEEFDQTDAPSQSVTRVLDNIFNTLSHSGILASTALGDGPDHEKTYARVIQHGISKMGAILEETRGWVEDLRKGFDVLHGIQSLSDEDSEGSITSDNQKVPLLTFFIPSGPGDSAFLFTKPPPERIEKRLRLGQFAFSTVSINLDWPVPFIRAVTSLADKSQLFMCDNSLRQEERAWLAAAIECHVYAEANLVSFPATLSGAWREQYPELVLSSRKEPDGDRFNIFSMETLPDARFFVIPPQPETFSRSIRPIDNETALLI